MPFSRRQAIYQVSISQFNSHNIPIAIMPNRGSGTHFSKFTGAGLPTCAGAKYKPKARLGGSMPMADIYADGTYSTKNPDWHTADSEWKASQITSLLSDHKLNPASCVEVGCGAGLILEHLQKRLHECRFSGFDVSPETAKFWRDRSPAIDFQMGDFTLSREHFDLLLLIDVFEHVEDYLGFLKTLSQRAEYFIFHIPLEMHVSAVLRDRHTHSREAVGHLHYFSRSTALATLASAGYVVIDERFTKLSQQTVEGYTTATFTANLARRFTELLSMKFAAKLLGGYSLLALCKAQAKQS
jgi:SAM-dependent methyltransferase